VRVGGVAQEALPRLRRPGEAHHVDVGMESDGLSHRGAAPRHDIEDAGRNTRLAGELGEAKSGERRLFGRLDDDRAARGQSRTDLPPLHHHGKFHGSTQPTTPTGSRTTRAVAPWPTGAVLS